VRRFIERCCGRRHASTSVERFRHDSGSCGQTVSGRMLVTQVAVTSGSNLEISRGQLGKDAFSRCNAMGGTLK
jgi:hypothetical protein